MNKLETMNGDVQWHSLELPDVLNRVSANSEGLSNRQAQERFTEFGPNRPPPPKSRNSFIRLVAQFQNVLVYVLAGAGIITAGLGHWIDAVVIFGVVIINAVIGFIQEGKAERALDAIRNILSPNATVLRDGRRVVIAADEVVPGDIIYLQSGDKVPADLRLIRTKNLQIQEAALTGESVPVEKSKAAVAADAPLGDRASMAYSGTIVANGQGTGVTVGTAARTEIGRISVLLGQVQPLTTPLLKQMAEFSRWLTGSILVIAVFTFAFGMLVRDYSATEMFMAAVGLAVAAIPEGLPAIMTITLAIGVQAMAQRNAIVRRLPAVETLGSVSVICSDKTGTLTKNEMTVQSIATSHHLFDVTGVGYAPIGSLLLNGNEVSPGHRPLLSLLTQGMFLCSDASLREVDGHWVVDGDPTEGALVSAAIKAGCEPNLAQVTWPRIDVIPFESEHRFMATLHHGHENRAVIYVKGAPERIFEMCCSQRNLEGDEDFKPAYWNRCIEEIASRGQRVLALAVWEGTDERRELRPSMVNSGLTLVGLMGLLDPPRQEAIAAVSDCQAAGIRVKMITGDHARTASAVAQQLGLANAEKAMTGQELDNLNDAQLADEVRRTDVFARMSPEHKLRLVEMIQTNGLVLAMTGDGVNDAPALKRADVGVAMGLKGTEAAKEAAEMVLADDNFATIALAVEKGRTVYDNLKKAITFILPTNGGEALTIIAAILFGTLLPITPVQILWVNMITAVTLALALAFEPAEANVMKRAPRHADEPILSRFLIWRIVFVSVILAVGTFGLFLWEQKQGAEIELARTVAVNTLVMFEVFYLFSIRYLDRSVFCWDGFTGSRPVLLAVVVVIGFQILFTYAPFLQVLFNTRAIPISSWGSIILVSSAVLFLVEAEKWIIRRYLQKDQTSSTSD